MQHVTIVLSLMLVLVLSGCTPDRSDGSDESAESEEQTKREGPVPGIADKIGGIRRGGESGFGRAADITR